VFALKVKAFWTTLYIQMRLCAAGLTGVRPNTLIILWQSHSVDVLR